MLTVHILSLVFSVGGIALADKEALAWLRGKKRTLNAARVRFLHRQMWLGLLFLIGSGAIMAYPMLSFLLTRPPFIAKMFFVAILLVNGFLIGRLQSIACEKAYVELTWEERLPLFLSGAISFFSWAAAVFWRSICFEAATS